MKKVQKLVFTEELVTPQQAAHWLKYNNPSNRPISKDTVARYARDMTRGAYKVTHQAIAFDWDGNLGNGQHRLSAIVMSGKPQTMIISRGENPANFPYFDRTKVRGAADTLSLMRIPNATVTSAAVRVLASLRQGKIDSQRRMEPDEILSFYTLNQAHLAPFCATKTQKLPAAVSGTLAFTHMTYPAESLAFFECVKTGIDLSATHPALHLREGLREHTARGRDPQKYQILHTLTAMRHFVNKTPVKILKTAVDPFAFFSAPQKQSSLAIAK